MRLTPLFAVVAVGVAAALAVQPVTTEHTTEADFQAAESDRATVWSLGEITLGPAATTVLESRKDVAVVTAMVVDADGAAYVGTAAEGLVLRIGVDGKVSTVADLDSAMVTDLALQGSRLLIATAGDAAGVYAVDLGAAGVAAAAKRVWADDEAAAVWAIAATEDAVYAATAPHGKLFAIDAAGEAKVVFTAKQKVLRSVQVLGSRVYVGAGADGLVYQVDVSAAEPTSRVILDAAEKEIVALVADAAGNIYAAGTNVTSAVATEPSKTDGGKPATAPASQPATAPASQPATAPASQPTTAPATTQPTSRPVAAAAAVALASPVIPKRPTPAQMMPSATAKPASTTKPAAQPKGRTPSGGAKGNTVYRIDADGFVKVVGKIPATILAMSLATQPNARLIIAAAGGQLRVIELASGASSLLVKIDPKKATAVAMAPDGVIYVGAAEPALVAKVSESAVTGTWVSKPVDAKQIARWGSARVRADMGVGAAVSLATRTGNVAEPTDETWSNWSAEIPVDGGWFALDSPAARFCQYRLTLTRKAALDASPVVDSVALVHQVGNLPPEIEAIEVTAINDPQKRPGLSVGSGEALRYRTVAIKAGDPNGDPLRFDLLYRLRGSEVWIRWAEDLEMPKAAWDTRTAADGVYELKVVATDAGANPPAAALTDERISRVVIVDNTPPRFAQIGASVTAGVAHLTAAIADANRISGVQYRIDSDETPVTVAAADGIFDSAAEKVAATIEDLPAGPHAVTVKVVDEFGNAAYATVIVTIGE